MPNLGSLNTRIPLSQNRKTPPENKTKTITIESHQYLRTSEPKHAESCEILLPVCHRNLAWWLTQVCEHVWAWQGLGKRSNRHSIAGNTHVEHWVTCPALGPLLNGVGDGDGGYRGAYQCVEVFKAHCTGWVYGIAFMVWPKPVLAFRSSHPLQVRCLSLLFKAPQSSLAV